MAIAQFVVTVEYTPRTPAQTGVEVEGILRDSITTGINESGAGYGPVDFIVDQIEVVPVVGGSIENPKALDS